MVATNDQWITERTGIRERHIVAKGVATSDLATEAARDCLAKPRPRRQTGRSHHRRHGHA